MKRRPANRKSNKKDFTRHAMKVHRKNIHAGPMRGGIRL